MQNPENQIAGLDATSYALLLNVDSLIRGKNIRGRRNLSACLEAMCDGEVLLDQVSLLVAKRLVEVHLVSKKEVANKVPCGKEWKIAFTERAISVFWPDRA